MLEEATGVAVVVVEEEEELKLELGRLGGENG